MRVARRTNDPETATTQTAAAHNSRDHGVLLFMSDRQHRTIRITNYVVSSSSNEMRLHCRALLCANNDQINRLFTGVLGDRARRRPEEYQKNGGSPAFLHIQKQLA